LYFIYLLHEQGSAPPFATVPLDQESKEPPEIKEVRTAGGGADRVKFRGVLPSCTHIRTKIRISPLNEAIGKKKMDQHIAQARKHHTRCKVQS
jgi:hypothetical protein